MKANLSIRKILIAFVVVVVLAMLILRGDQLVELAETMRQGSSIPLFLAIASQLGKYFLQSVAYTYAFEAVGERYAARNTLPLVFGTFFMNTIAPSANLAGITLVVDDARRRGISAGKAGSAALLMQITIDSGFGVILIVGFTALALTVGLPIGWFLLALIDITAVGAMVFVLFLGRRHPKTLRKVFNFAERTVNRVLTRFKRKPIKPWANRSAESFTEAAGLIVSNPKSTAKAFFCSIGASTCELVCFVLVGIGFGVYNPQSLVCGYVVATLFAMFSITPQGVGFVEAAVLVAFTTFGESSAAGMAIGLVYRGIVFWLPFLIGAVLIQMTSTFKGDSRESADDASEEENDAAAQESRHTRAEVHDARESSGDHQSVRREQRHSHNDVAMEEESERFGDLAEDIARETREMAQVARSVLQTNPYDKAIEIVNEIDAERAARDEAVSVWPHDDVDSDGAHNAHR